MLQILEKIIPNLLKGVLKIIKIGTTNKNAQIIATIVEIILDFMVAGYYLGIFYGMYQSGSPLT